jgi:peptidoglycan/LPS O-acetylase OafA/YrhL
MDVPRKNNLDFIRFVLATIVIFSHSWPLATGSEAREPLIRLSRGQMTDGFFILSGLLIYQSWQRSPCLNKFLRKRISRIYPGFIVTIFLSAFVFSVAASDSPDIHVWARLKQSCADAVCLRQYNDPTAFRHNPFPGYVNGSLWTIRFEFVCYLMIAALGMCGLLMNRLALRAIFVACWAAHLASVITAFQPKWPVLHLLFEPLGGLFRLATYFLAGVLLNQFRENIVLTKWGALICVATLLLSARIPYGLNVTVPLVGGYLLIAFAWLPLRLSRWGQQGDFSYGIYLYAFPVQQLIVCYGRIRTPAALFLTSAPIAILCGIASWYGVERFFLRRAVSATASQRETGFYGSIGCPDLRHSS